MNDFANKLLLTSPGETLISATGDLSYSTGRQGQQRRAARR